jgi:rsbT antagonist protein RsbS
MSDVKETVSINKIHDALLVKIPLDASDEEIEIIQGKILKNLEDYDVNGVVLDISKVEVVDSFFARTITETTQMVDLMGAKTVVAGMNPSVAITTVELGFNLGNALFALNVDKGFDLLKL